MTTYTRRHTLGLLLIPAALTIGVALTVGAAGCTAHDTVQTQPSVAPTSAAPPAPTTPAAPVSPSAPAPAPSSTGKGTSIKGGCPVSTQTLVTAFKSNAEISHDLILGKGLQDVLCYQDYATAVTMPDNMDPASVLFTYNKKTAKWSAVAGGTDMSCDKWVPAAIITHLPRCHPAG
jgi:hypothetical protein